MAVIYVALSAIAISTGALATGHWLIAAYGATAVLLCAFVLTPRRKR